MKDQVTGNVGLFARVYNAVSERAVWATTLALGLLVALTGGSALAQATYTQTAWGDGIQFPIDLGVISTVLFAAGGAVLVAVFTPGGGFRLVTKAFYGVLKMIRV